MFKLVALVRLVAEDHIDHAPKGPGPGIQKNIFTLVCTAHSRSASRLLVMKNVHTADRVAHNEGNTDSEER
jgi:hypothetical protein